MPRNRSYDYIVVGAGSAGCVLANRLSANPDRSVLLIEAGGKDRNPLFRLPMLMGKLFHSGIYNWRYHTEPVPSLEGRSLYWPRGKVLGGSSTINGMIYVRGNRHDYDRWAQMGLPGWSYDEVLPAFRRSEGHLERDGIYHGTDGELTVCRARGGNPLFDAFVEAGRQAGHPVNDDFNGADEQEGFGRYDFTIRRGRRCSASTAFLDPIRHRRNLAILTNSLVRRVVVEGGRATGIEVAQQGGVQTIHAEREVILCAGTVNSPQLLMLSGIGPGDALKRHAIKAIHELPGVGRNLQDHVDCVLAYACTKPITLYRDLRADRLIR
ncbi:MAG: GMC family oxidoreductase N-terminal domain-containing protein, partial [Rhodospirillales bacterium]|nr:GMC family oxidoreductase N-terminal domain-containing protein [Rhodospirillales bacterium]